MENMKYILVERLPHYRWTENYMIIAFDAEYMLIRFSTFFMVKTLKLVVGDYYLYTIKSKFEKLTVHIVPNDRILNFSLLRYKVKMPALAIKCSIEVLAYTIGREKEVKVI